MFRLRGVKVAKKGVVCARQKAEYLMVLGWCAHLYPYVIEGHDVDTMGDLRVCDWV